MLSSEWHRSVLEFAASECFKVMDWLSSMIWYAIYVGTSYYILVLPAGNLWQRWETILWPGQCSKRCACFMTSYVPFLTQQRVPAFQYCPQVFFCVTANMPTHWYMTLHHLFITTYNRLMCITVKNWMLSLLSFSAAFECVGRNQQCWTEVCGGPSMFQKLSLTFLFVCSPGHARCALQCELSSTHIYSATGSRMIIVELNPDFGMCPHCRSNYVAAWHAAKLMVPAKQGLIVNISSAGGLRYLFNVAYGVGKAAVCFQSPGRHQHQDHKQKASTSPTRDCSCILHHGN